MDDVASEPAPRPHVAAVRVGEVREVPDGPGPGAPPWRTGLWKRPVEGRVNLRRDHLEGDAQADLVHHGGVDKAVCVYPSVHYAAWRDELGIHSLGPGGFGENLSVEGLDEASTCLGDVYECGDAVVEVSQPRAPCWKIARRWGVEDLAVRVRDTGRTGWYLRVLEEGRLGAGDALRLVARPYPRWTVVAVSGLRHGRTVYRAALEDLLAVDALAESWRTALSARVPPSGA